jgi:hypothetical protein
MTVKRLKLIPRKRKLKRENKLNQWQRSFQINKRRKRRRRMGKIQKRRGSQR